MDADILCFQETKVTRDMLTEPLGKLLSLLYMGFILYQVKYYRLERVLIWIFDLAVFQRLKQNNVNF